MPMQVAAIALLATAGPPRGLVTGKAVDASLAMLAAFERALEAATRVSPLSTHRCGNPKGVSPHNLIERPTIYQRPQVTYWASQVPLLQSAGCMQCVDTGSQGEWVFGRGCHTLRRDIGWSALGVANHMLQRRKDSRTSSSPSLTAAHESQLMPLRPRWRTCSQTMVLGFRRCPVRQPNAEEDAAIRSWHVFDGGMKS